jgi:SAM-dependent methyltransferase
VDNPWLDIPLSDYEAHMALPQVAQARMLSDQFASLLAEQQPRSVAVIGCAGGNGFERIDPQRTERVVGIDLNPNYIDVVRGRYQHVFRSLELICIDIESSSLPFDPVELIFAGLIFEYVDAGVVLPKLRDQLQPRGVLAALVQLPARGSAAITRTRFSSLEKLATLIRLLPPEQLIGEARNAALRLESAVRIDPSTGKQFQLLMFRAGALP